MTRSADRRAEPDHLDGRLKGAGARDPEGGLGVAEVFGAAVRWGAVPEQVADPVIDAAGVQISRHEALIAVPGVGRFHVAGGRSVTVEADAGVPAAACTIWLHGLIAAVVLGQQGRFALHASAVRVGGVVVAVAGDSGAGKSTTVAALSCRGHELLTDEVTAVDLDGGRPVIRALPRVLRLDPATATRLGVAARRGTVPDPGGKVAVDLPAAGTAVLDRLVVLGRSPSVPVPVAEVLDGLHAVDEVRRQTYRRSLAALDPLGHHRWVATLARRVPAIRVTRPASGWTVPGVVEVVESFSRR